ncbi:TonB box-like protein [Thermus sp. 2.9]|uniref:DUF1653 domain-containing protein n=1 Tax=unclassified Thermus TaxID=2619321 RepID=UPI00054399FE|nr:DUF1653 domain-containing protein [Thermus sp. 2.9]KHG65089.1 TonB box-like protein [Thermus sp. 2.9]
MPVEPGLHRRHKGGLYRVLFLPRRSETEELVAYQALYGKGGCWARPLASWLAPVEGRWVPRFPPCEG